MAEIVPCVKYTIPLYGASKMKIGKPCPLPFDSRSKYAAIYAKVEKLKSGEAVPVTMTTEGKADYFAWSARHAKHATHQPYKVVKRGLTVYVALPMLVLFLIGCPKIESPTPKLTIERTTWPKIRYRSDMPVKWTLERGGVPCGPECGTLDVVTPTEAIYTPPELPESTQPRP